MRDQLLEYYERELTFLRRMGEEFAAKYPKIAGRLLLEPDKCEDPHVERLIEAFAFLAARIHLKMDDEFPEITESLLNILYPHYLAPIPSMSIVQFVLDPTQGKITAGYPVQRGTLLFSRPIQGTPCRFRTCYPMILWPIEVLSAVLEDPEHLERGRRSAELVLRLRLQCVNETRLSQLKWGEGKEAQGIDSLRFYLHGEPQIIYPLYELLFNRTLRMEIRAVRSGKMPASAPLPNPIRLSASCLQPVGFAAEESMLPYSPRSFRGYGLLSEYFAFPDKFHFMEISGLQEAARAGFGEQFDILIHLEGGFAQRPAIHAGHFQLGCTPIINLFSKVAEPIQLSQQQHEYHLIPDVHRQFATEIYSIDAVTATDPLLKEARPFQPFYSIRHAAQREKEQAYWYAARRPSVRKEDPGTEMYLSLVDLNFNPHVPAVETITVHTTSTNRDLPGKLPFGGSEGDFEVEGIQSLSRIRCLKKPTGTIRPPLRQSTHWRLISHLSLNYLSLVDDAQKGSPEALQEILMLYDFTDSAAIRKQIQGITRVESRRVVRQTGAHIGSGLIRGMETTVEFDEEQFVGGSVFLFASVLDRFLGLYASINSFNQLVVKTKQREGILRRWPPKAGEQILL